ncbi:hypothetical protein L615_001000000830 [Nocardioides sp. J9]|uniref:hypothetical protein n=1 Tax=Nocardioides sp. J9 TaxID=935844 RepID=UPI0011A701B4|nr:hypothetical protein [Nocardioides sp. J9]TWH04750.1 hypothetical protein L615_001000000830 [Nocardioides sp. J9]
MGQTREALAPDDVVPADLGRYIRTIDELDFQSFDFSDRVVANAWAIDGGAWQHILFSADVPNVFLVIVVNGRSNDVHGHYVLDLNSHYGIGSDPTL